MLTSLMRPFFRKGQARSFVLPGAVSDSSRILCIDPGDLTDLLFHVPLVNAIRQRYPRARIDFLVPEKHAPLIKPSGLTKQCLAYKDGQLNPWRPSFSALLRQLSTQNYDVTLVMSVTPRPRLELAGLASGAALRIGPSHAESWPAINFEIRPGEGDEQYLGDRVRHMGPFLGLSPADLGTRWPLPMDQVRQMAQQIHFHKPNPDQMLVGVDPTVSKTGFTLSQENFQFLIRQLTSQLICRVIALGDPTQREKLDKLETRLSDVPIGLPRSTILETVLLLSQCDLFLAGNTDLFHFAVALGVPTIGLFAPQDPPAWEPRGRRKARVIRLPKEGKIDLETLMETVEAVTEGRTSTATTVIAESDAPSDADETGTPPAPGQD